MIDSRLDLLRVNDIRPGEDHLPPQSTDLLGQRLAVPPVPAEDREGNPHDFSLSARIEGAREVDLTDQGQFDTILGSSHLGILNSPAAWQAGFRFLTRVGPR